MRLLLRLRRVVRPTPNAIRPGWYRIEDESRERWHDNYGWSEHYRPAEGVDRL